MFQPRSRARGSVRALRRPLHPDWSGEDNNQGSGAPYQGGAISIKDAYDILGLEPGANKDDIRDAHRQLIKTHHPDRGGSTWLAARINEAKEVLLRHIDEG